MLDDADEWMFLDRDEIDKQIREGIEELDRGEGIPEEQLDEYLGNLKAQAD